MTVSSGMPAVCVNLKPSASFTRDIDKEAGSTYNTKPRMFLRCRMSFLSPDAYERCLVLITREMAPSVGPRRHANLCVSRNILESLVSPLARCFYLTQANIGDLRREIDKRSAACDILVAQARTDVDRRGVNGWERHRHMKKCTT